MSDIQATPADDTPQAAATVTAAPADAGNTSASAASTGATSTTDSASPVSGSTSEAATTEAAAPTEAAPVADAAPAPVVTPAAPVAPAVSDGDMANAAAQLEMLANLYTGISFAKRALEQVGSLGSAISTRQGVLADINGQIATAQAQLDALQGDVARNTEGANTIVSAAVTSATKTQADADAYAQGLKQNAINDSAILRAAAVAECDQMRATADAYVTQAKADVGVANSDLANLQARITVAQGEFSDLETKVAVGRANLRALLGDSQ